MAVLCPLMSPAQLCHRSGRAEAERRGWALEQHGMLGSLQLLLLREKSLGSISTVKCLSDGGAQSLGVKPDCLLCKPPQLVWDQPRRMHLVLQLSVAWVEHE